MKEFVEKLIERLESRKENVLPSENYLFGNIGLASVEGFNRGLKTAISIVNQLAEEYSNSMENQIASNYAKWIAMCGVDVTEKWLTATQQSFALNEAYMRGRQDEINRFKELQEVRNE